MLSICLHEKLTSVKIPLFMSLVQAGFPSPAADYAEERLDFNDLLVHHKAATYCLRVSGESMIGAGIFPGDIIVVDRSLRPVNGDVVVAAVSGEFTVKRFYRSGGRVELRPENPDYAPICIEHDQEFELFGVVSSVVRQYRKG